MTTLPKEIEEEFEREFRMRFYDSVADGMPWQFVESDGDEVQEFCKSFIAKVYITARRQALTEAIEFAQQGRQPGRTAMECDRMFVAGFEYFRAEAIAKLTQLRDV